ncbi:hypothetical protein PIIN_05682 [Serendipita indica DSM 11827]|uniref:DUF6535 domain-containing protein n=1 Tax=Serendipita indica (strain DSM 11827) TaxID=1109443 RepID=G4TKB6_SERID|nr:hypothetical protein PIIN_05682 [Serendipita indica DSM 11827]
MSHEEKAPKRPLTRLGIPLRERKPRSKTNNNKVEKTAWEIYNERAENMDRDLTRDWHESLGTLLTFVSRQCYLKLQETDNTQGALYTAVLTAFIIESMKLLQEDTGETTRDILLVVSRQLANASTPAFEHEEFTPEAWAVRVNYCFLTSISCSLVAALGAVLALQWVGSYDFGLIRSSAKMRATQRQLRYNGIKKWKLAQLISILPLLIYISLFLFFIGLADWLWHIHRSVASVVVAGVVIGGLFYLVTHIISIFDISAPFRTPISLSVSYMIQKLHWWLVNVLSWLKQYFGLQQRQRHDKTFSLQQFMKHEVGKLHSTWIKFRSLLPALRKAITAPSTPHYFKHRERKELDFSATTLHRDSILWLAKNIDDIPSSRSAFVSLLKEVVQVPYVQLIGRRMESNLWPAIFQNVFRQFYEMEDVIPEVFSNAALEELEALLEALALVGIRGTSDKYDGNIWRLCFRLHQSNLGRVSTFSGLVLWKIKEIHGHSSLTSLPSIVNQEPDLITSLSDSWAYMILHCIYNHGKPEDNPELAVLLTPLTLPEYYGEKHQLLGLPTIFILMRIVLRIHGYNADADEPWEQYREAVSHIPEAKGDCDTVQICHTVILLQLLSHAPKLQNHRSEVLHALLQAHDSLSKFDDLRLLILGLLTHIVKPADREPLKSQLMTALAVVICWPNPPSSELPAGRWADILEGSDRILSQSGDSRFSLNLLVSSLLRAAEVTGYPVRSSGQATGPALTHPVILVLASLVLPDRYSLGPLKDMDFPPEIRKDSSYQDLLKAWCRGYTCSSNRDIESECIVLLESAEMLDAICMTIHQSNKIAYWNALLTNHLDRLLSNPKAPSILKEVGDTPVFPDRFFEAGGISRVVTSLREPYKKSQEDAVERLVLRCIQRATSMPTFYNSLSFVAAYIEAATLVYKSGPSYNLLMELLQNIHDSQEPPERGFSSFMHSLFKNVDDQLKAEIQTLIMACKRQYLLSGPVDNKLRLIKDPDGVCQLHRPV